MPISDNEEYQKLDAQLRQLKALERLRPLYRLMGEKGRDALQALDQRPELERKLAELRIAADEFNEYFLPRGWIAHEQMNYDVAHQAVELAKAGDLDAGEVLLVESIDRAEVGRALQRMRRLDEFRIREDLLLLALEDHCAGRYHASVMPLLAQVDGIVHDLTMGTFFINESSNTRKLVINNSIVGHIEGIGSLAAALSSSRPTTTRDSIDLPYRHGILHGRDLGYANRTVSAKCLALLLALCAFAEHFDRERLRQLVLVPPQTPTEPSPGEALAKLLDVHQPSTYFLAFPPPMVGNSRKYTNPRDPNHSLTTIPHVCVQRLARELRALGFKSPPPARLVGGLLWHMEWKSRGADYHVDIAGPSSEAVWCIDASFCGFPPQATKQHACDFLGFVATVPYRGAEPSTAQRWVRDHSDSSAETQIGDARFTIFEAGMWTTLTIAAINVNLGTE